MKLSYTDTYLSIGEFDDVVLPQFAIVTGLNGSGKTHLLNAIRNGNVAVEGISLTEMVYFDYTDFMVDPPTTGYPTRSQNATASNQQGLLHQRIVGTQKKLVDLSPLQQLLLPHWINRRFVEVVLADDSWKPFEEIRADVSDAASLEEYKEKMGTEFFTFLTAAINSQIPLEDLTKSETRLAWESLDEQFREQMEAEFPGYIDFILKNSELGSLRFTSSQLLASEIATEVQEYATQIARNDHNEIRARHEHKKKYLEPNEFINRFGRPPIEELNAVLQEYDCNGYQFKVLNDVYPEPGAQAPKANIALAHSVRGYTANFQDLSSGEKTLLALALIVRKARSATLPRLLLLDEIDTTLHPSMIDRLMTVIRQVFVEQKGMNVILATHSPTTVAFSPDNAVFVLDRTPKLVIKPQSREDAVEFLTEGFATLNRSLTLLDSISNRPVSILTEGRNTAYLKKANEFFGNSSIDIIEGMEGLTGKDQLKSLFTFFSRVKHSNIVVFVWDCDADFNLTEANNTFPFIFAKNESTGVTSGIENLFPESLFDASHYVRKPKSDGGAHISLDKKAFERYVIANGTKEDFKNFEPLFVRIQEIRDST